MASVYTFTSYNSHGIGKDILDYIQKPTNVSDFVIIQEHWLHEKDNNYFKKNLCNVKSHAISGMNPTELLQGRPFAGCAILWKSNLQHKIVPIQIDSKSICAVKIILNEETILIVNVYMPCYKQNEAFTTEYSMILSEIAILCLRENASHVILGGDFNTDFSMYRCSDIS